MVGRQDHYVIVIVWLGKMRMVKFFLLSIGKAGHTAEAAAKAMQKVVQWALGDEVEVYCKLADSGSGAAVQNQYPKLVEMGLMKKDSKEASCTLIGMQKSHENASVLRRGRFWSGNLHTRSTIHLPPLFEVGGTSKMKMAGSAERGWSDCATVALSGHPRSSELMMRNLHLLLSYYKKEYLFVGQWPTVQHYLM